MTHDHPLPCRIADQRFEKAAYFVFGDFNFRLDSKSVVEVGAHPATDQILRRRLPVPKSNPRWAWIPHSLSATFPSAYTWPLVFGAHSGTLTHVPEP